jgi:hypothetical protein
MRVLALKLKTFNFNATIQGDASSRIKIKLIEF